VTGKLHVYAVGDGHLRLFAENGSLRSSAAITGHQQPREGRECLGNPPGFTNASGGKAKRLENHPGLKGAWGPATAHLSILISFPRS
jgi:hypothetical protein